MAVTRKPKMIKIIRRCQNSRLVEGFHPLFHESVVAPLFVGVCGCFVGVCGCFWVFVGVRGVTICHYLAQTCPWDHLARRRKKNCRVIKNDLDAATFVNQIFRNFGWNDNVKSFFLHCGDELNGLGPSWMVLTHGNVIFDILEPPAFQKYSICWVFRAFFCSTFFYMYFATRPRPALTAVEKGSK